MNKLYTNYVSTIKDDAHPTEIVYWEDAMRKILNLKESLTKQIELNIELDTELGKRNIELQALKKK